MSANRFRGIVSSSALPTEPAADPDATERQDHPNRELAPADFAKPNPTATPEIYVGRIDARGVALGEQAGAGGLRLDDLVARERGLLVEYFERNHEHRTGAYRGDHELPAALETFADGEHRMDLMRRLSPARWGSFSDSNYYIREGQSDLAKTLAWYRRPALLRMILSHSNGVSSGYLESTEEDIRTALSMAPGEALPPFRDDLSAPYFRIIYRRELLPRRPVFYIHGGCEVTAPPFSDIESYTGERYGQDSNAACHLFYARGLAFLGRAKVYYDSPDGFVDALLVARSSWGEAWMAYHAGQSNATGREAIDRKRAYSWLTLGDPTLTLFGPGE